MYVGDTVRSDASSGCGAQAHVAKPSVASIYDQGQRYDCFFKQYSLTLALILMQSLIYPSLLQLVPFMITP